MKSCVHQALKDPQLIAYCMFRLPGKVDTPVLAYHAKTKNGGRLEDALVLPQARHANQDSFIDAGFQFETAAQSFVPLDMQLMLAGLHVKSRFSGTAWTNVQDSNSPFPKSARCVPTAG